MLLKVEPVPLQLNVANGLYLKIASNLADLNNAVVARASLGLGSLATVNDAPSDGTVYGRQNGAWAAASVLPVVDETAIVFETGVPANTLTFDVSAYTAARIVAWPDAAMTVAGLEVANVFTAAQTINGNISANRFVFNGDTNTWELTGREAAIAPFGVPYFRTTVLNNPTALDVMPNGNAAGVDVTGHAWIHICNSDLSPIGSTNFQALLLSAGVDRVAVGAHSNGLAVLPLKIGGSTITFASQANPGGTEYGGFTSTGLFVGSTITGIHTTLYQSELRSKSGFQLRWVDSAADNTGTIDTGLSRSSAGVIEVNNGTAGTYRDVELRTINPLSSVMQLGPSATKVFYVPNQTDFLGTMISGGGGTSLSHTTGNEGRYNAIFGIDAGHSLTTGYQNMFLGYQVGYDTTTGYQNAFIGYWAGLRTNTGYQNMFLGTEAGFNNTSGIQNVFIGFRAGYKTTTGYQNVAIGSGALNENQTGVRNTAIGYQAGLNGLGNYCVNIGYRAGYSNTASSRLFIEPSDVATPLIYGEFDNGILKFHSTVNSDAVISTLSLVRRRATGIPGVGMGSALRFGLHSSTTEDQDAAHLIALWQTATHASRVADLVAYASYSGGESEIWRGRAGAAPLFGVLGATPVVRQTHIADPAGGGTVDAEARTAINSILVVLENFGFVATS